jgi:hypothetical protein
MIESRGLDRFFAEQDWALALDALAAGKPSRTPLEHIPELFVRQFAELNHDLLRTYFDTTTPEHLWLTLWRALAAEFEPKQDLDHLAEIVDSLPAEQQIELADWLNSRQYRAPALRAALDQAIGKPESSWQRLKQRIFSRASPGVASKERGPHK